MGRPSRPAACRNTLPSPASTRGGSGSASRPACCRRWRQPRGAQRRAGRLVSVRAAGSRRRTACPPRPRTRSRTAAASPHSVV
eukprot:scaffold3206_cov72-Phaeocystis_antarctica.AAC.3